MIRLVSILCLVLVACGDDGPTPPLRYTDPGAGALRLVKNKETTPTIVVLDLIVGDQPLVGYATGFNLALDTTKVTLAEFRPGTALAPGSDPIAAKAMIPDTGPLTGMLVAAQSQKAAGTGAVPTDTELAPKTVLFTVRLDLIADVEPGIVFDGTATGFVLASGGLRDRAGLTVVEPSGVAIGKLEVTGAKP